MRRGGVKSFVDDLVLGRGVVISRAATSLRSVETQPLTRRFVRFRRTTSPSWSLPMLLGRSVGRSVGRSIDREKHAPRRGRVLLFLNHAGPVTHDSEREEREKRGERPS
ncbi:hypothetical protein Btru_066320 [Bulinus truncatus]|nr:hypothetical protein Btru_066320 [Bulinus truncatus]